ncbi:MAG: class I SAM-dependent DNA methyltransferase [Methylobacter sp.]|uniref:type I restriction-modification system subunit M n=1 Tax=Methylobacter sp. TaxID=2051955 RepID=UPI00273122DD|nr:class I SAM-dependent DNA methyltransferase [Methylobacter sp.]MDP1664472.1 class I SAM-dependent DNA methyltransferase [Methylobacter sp.]
MLAPHIKKKVDKLWDRFWSAGLTNPLVAVEQITYLLFLKRLEDIDKKRIEKKLPSIYALTAAEQAQIQAAPPEKREALRKQLDAEPCRWSYIRQEKTNPAHLIERVFPWLRGIEARLTNDDNDTELGSLNNRMADAYFQLDPNKGQVLGDAIDLIDQLFARVGDGSAAQDIMGDTFEHLLSEMSTAGKNGQFRTPRHLIRFMVELLDPEPGQRIIDPAAGTGGFLFSAQQYLMRKYSAQDIVLLEWDGTPHRAHGTGATKEQYAAIHHGANFVGLDNDRTMARIGWMNLVLHDVTDPHLLQGDSLSKRDGKPKLAELLKSESYDFVLANPPFTGTVDTNDLEKDSLLFPRVGGGGKKKDDALTNKSELLFLWLMLDLLDVGGSCAVIIPEGVLFGNTDAHKSLRRELLTEHVVEGVISLPGGVFQPYTGVKTSILLFRKETRREEKQSFTGQNPRTEYVWFYEVEEDGFTRDAKRNGRPGQRNDLWDALVKFKIWKSEGRTGAKRFEKTLLQPSFHPERWRQALLRDTADKLTPAGEAFAALPDTNMWDGQVWGIHELFSDLPTDPKEAESFICEKVRDDLEELLTDRLADYIAPAHIKSTLNSKENTELTKAYSKFITETKRLANACRGLFEPDDSPALKVWNDLITSSINSDWLSIDAYSSAEQNVKLTADKQGQPTISFDPRLDEGKFKNRLLGLAREVAKLDGFDVTLRSLAIDQETDLTAAKHWVVPVREWLLNDEWQSADGSLKGSHDANGLVRPQYVETMLAKRLYDEKGQLKDGLLDPDCIEARDWNLSAGQYKPFDLTQLKSDKSVVELIGELLQTEQQIIRDLDKLLVMVEERE